MIEITEDQVKQVEYLLSQSKHGNHVLFAPEELRRVFLKPKTENQPLETKDAERIESHIERLLAQPTLGQKRAYLERLDRRTFEWVVRTYFNILENNLLENGGSELRH